MPYFKLIDKDIQKKLEEEVTPLCEEFTFKYSRAWEGIGKISNEELINSYLDYLDLVRLIFEVLKREGYSTGVMRQTFTQREICEKLGISLPCYINTNRRAKRLCQHPCRLQEEGVKDGSVFTTH